MSQPPSGEDASPAEPPSATTMRLPDVGDTAADTGNVFADAPAQGETGEPALSSADQATVDALRTGTALLLVQHGPNAGARFLLDNDVTTVGRHPSNDIFLDDVTVSRKHAEFRRGSDGFTLRDVGSLNGTYVRRARIDGQVLLQTGDEVQIGKFRFLFQLSAGAPGSAGEDGGTS